MAQVCKLLSFASGCCGVALLAVALLAVPQSSARANDPSGVPLGLGNVYCQTYGVPKDGCVLLLDPCLRLEDCKNLGAGCGCRQ